MVLGIGSLIGSSAQVIVWLAKVSIQGPKPIWT
jgi:hypothetical protein